MSETIYSKRFGFSIWLLQSQLPFQRWRSTFISSCETDSLYIAFASFSSLSCCFYERFFAIDWLFVHLCMHKINLLPCVSMALAKEGSPKIILIKSCGGHFLWKRVWNLGWAGPVGQFPAHKFQLNKLETDLCFVYFLVFLNLWSENWMWNCFCFLQCLPLSFKYY